jgi:hypothetical protein
VLDGALGSGRYGVLLSFWGLNVVTEVESLGRPGGLGIISGGRFIAI